MKKKFLVLVEVLTIAIMLVQPVAVFAADVKDESSLVLNTEDNSNVKFAEGLKVSGGQLKTGINYSIKDSLEMTFQVSQKQYSNIIEAKNKLGFNVLMCRQEFGLGFFVNHGWWNERACDVELNKDIKLTLNKSTIFINDEKKRTMYAQNLGNSTDLTIGNFNGIIKEFKVYDEDGKLVADYKPALDSDNKACMYDAVNKQYKYFSKDVEITKLVEKVEDTENSENVEHKENSTDVTYVDELKINNGVLKTGIHYTFNHSFEMIYQVSQKQYSNLIQAKNSKGVNVVNYRQEFGLGFYLNHGWWNEKACDLELNKNIKLKLSKNTIFINDEQKRSLFSQNLGESEDFIIGNFYGTIKELRVWDENGELIAEYKPALDTSDKPCMYDSVSKEYKYFIGNVEAINVHKNEEEIKEPEKEPEEEPVKDKKSYTLQELKEKFKEMIFNADTSMIDLSENNYTYMQIYPVLEELEAENKEIRLAEACHGSVYVSIGEWKNENKRIVNKIYLNGIDPDNYFRRYETAKARINEVLSFVNSNPEMTDLDKLLYAHEYICEIGYYKDNSQIIQHRIGGILGDGYGVCESYANSYKWLLDELGIENKNVSSYNHVWNLVKLNGEWYHIDTTWDDSRNPNGNISHNYFLRNDKEFSSNCYHQPWWTYVNHEKATADKSTSTKYTNWFVHDVVHSKMFYYNGKWYYKNDRDNSLYRGDVEGKKQEKLVAGNSSIKIDRVENGILYYYLNNTLYQKNI